MSEGGKFKNDGLEGLNLRRGDSRKEIEKGWM
jgi:hypothetical protein